MNKEYYEEKGFELYGIMIPSDKYAQGIDIMYPSGHKHSTSDNQPAVYILTDIHGKVMKIGETQDLSGRFRYGYRTKVNTTNDKIREHIKTVDNIWVYVLPMPIRTEKVLGFKCETSYAKGLEYNLLKEYEEKMGSLPSLNVMKK
tara:strand:- start:280 stop:714 length:435 start_codon:yes stop_codon:yes gene_type:complete